MASDFRRYLGRTVFIQLDEHTLTGSLLRESRTAVTLSRAQLVPEDAEPIPMDGEIVIDKVRILWLQADV